MKYIAPKSLKEIKEIDLLTYLRLYEPHELVHVSHDMYSTRTHDSVRISNGMWNQFSSGIGGKSALDYLIKVRSMSFIDAANMLAEKSNVIPVDYCNLPAPAVQKRKALLLPVRHKNNDSAIAYLISRGINKNIVNDFIEKGLIYETHFHHDTGRLYKNSVFIGEDPGGMTRYASIRGINTDYKGDATGSNKHYSFRSLCDFRVMKTVHVFESAIDLLSYATLLKMHGNDYLNYDLLSLAGIYQPKKNMEESKVPAALMQYFDDNSNIEKIILHLDNDKAGRLATKAIMAIMPDKYEVVDRSPKQGKDFNDYLLTLIKERNFYQPSLCR